MKKNLRIVSAAAAALLAVAPVAAGVVPAANTVVSAATTDDLAPKGTKVVTSKPNVWLYEKKTIGGVERYVPVEVSGQALKLNEGTHLTVTGSAFESIHVYKNSDPATTPFESTKLYPVTYKGNKAFVDAGQVVKATKPVTEVNVETTTNSKGQVLTAANGEKLVVEKPIVLFNDDNMQYHIPENTKLTVVKNFSDGKVEVKVPYGTKVSEQTGVDENGKPVYRTVKLSADITLTMPNSSLINTKVFKDNASSTQINAGAASIFHNDANTTVNVYATAMKKINGQHIPSAINGSINVSYAGKNYEALLHGAQNTTVYTMHGEEVSASGLSAGHYIARLNHVTVNFGTENRNKTISLSLSRGIFESNGDYTKSVTTDSNGVADLGAIQVPFYAYDATKEQGVHFYDVKTGNVVTSGNVTLHAVNGKLNVESVFAAMSAAYGASQFRGGIDHDNLRPLNDLKDQLKKQNITVDPNGYFTPASSSFTLNLNAKSNLNGATATLPVTVNVDNVTPTAANESTTTKTIMHIATIYDKNGVATHEPVLRAYNSVEVVAEPVTLKDSKGKDAGKFYKLAGKDQYIKVGNIDGTSRTLKKNAVIYKSTGKPYMKSKKHRKIVKAGSTHTTYGKSFMIAGHQMYRVGRNQYIKKANF